MPAELLRRAKLAADRRLQTLLGDESKNAAYSVTLLISSSDFIRDLQTEFTSVCSPLL
jgi:hypothetical protein